MSKILLNIEAPRLTPTSDNPSLAAGCDYSLSTRRLAEWFTKGIARDT